METGRGDGECGSGEEVWAVELSEGGVDQQGNKIWRVKKNK